MKREVSFAVACADTRLGMHVRVVGSSAVLGNWNPKRGIPLSTGPTDFPMWLSPVSHLIQDDVIEYKYVICDHDGKAVRWEERHNRIVHFSALVGRGIIQHSGAVMVHEVFNSGSEEDKRFGDTDLVTKKPTSFKISQHANKEDLIAPTIRERLPSMSLLADIATDSGPTRRRSSSISHLGRLADAEVDASDAMPPAGSSGNEYTLAREESSSNLFNPADEDEADEAHAGNSQSEFEDKYSLVGTGPLGEGTFGLVWLCAPKRVNGTETKERAAKIVRKARLQPRDMRYLLGEDGEVRTHLTMKHRHVAELFEFFDSSQTVTLVLEYCRGGDLFDAIVKKSKETGRAFSENEAAIATSHVLSALAYIHGQCVVHRDIKCENILLSLLNVPVEQNVFKLCDFGFAAHDRGDGLTDRLGSPDTVAPEVVMGGRYSFAVDLWSAGVLIYMMLSATPPFYAPTDGEVLRKVRTGSYTLSGEPWDSISSKPKSLISALMTVEAKHRLTAAQARQSDWLKDVPEISATP